MKKASSTHWQTRYPEPDYSRQSTPVDSAGRQWNSVLTKEHAAGCVTTHADCCAAGMEETKDISVCNGGIGDRPLVVWRAATARRGRRRSAFRALWGEGGENALPGCLARSAGKPAMPGKYPFNQLRGIRNPLFVDFRTPVGQVSCECGGIAQVST